MTDSIEQGKAALFAGIDMDVRAEAKEIVAEAQKQAREKEKYAEKKAESILNAARKQAQEQAEQIRAKMRARTALEIKQRAMRVQTEVVEEVTRLAEKKLAAMVGQDSYRSVLRDWIVEAAVGLGADSALINASEPERAMIDERLIAEAHERIEACSGMRVKLELSDSPPLADQGVILTAADGRTAYDNRLKTRILRKQRGIRTLIYDALFTENRKEQS